MSFGPLSWHQAKAIERTRQLAHVPACIHGPDYIRTGLSLCGKKNPRVYIAPEHRNNPNNKPCKKCKAKADELGW